MTALLLLLGCPSPTPSPIDVPVPPAPPPVAPMSPAETPIRTAKVMEVLEGGGEYTYVRFDACGSEAWVAGPRTDLKVGQFASMPEGMGMENFHSPTLDRDFSVILFVDWFKVTEVPPDCGGAQAGAPKPRPPTGVRGKVLETMEAGGYRYARIDVCGSETWIAGPQVPVQVGEVVQTGAASPMDGFQSKTLDKTFERILFVKSIAIDPKPLDCP